MDDDAKHLGEKSELHLAAVKYVKMIFFCISSKSLSWGNVIKNIKAAAEDAKVAFKVLIFDIFHIKIPKINHVLWEYIM